VALGGYKIIHKAGDDETDYKFHRSAKLAPGEIATVCFYLCWLDNATCFM